MFKRWNLSNVAFESVSGTTVSHSSYESVHVDVLNTVAWLRACGLERGDVLCVQLSKSRRLLNLLLAGLAMGVPVLPLNDRYTASEVSYYVKDVRATLSIVLVEPTDWDGMVLLASEIPEVLPTAEDVDLPSDISADTLALLLYTSGTTGRPKGAMVSHGNLLASIEALHQAWEWNDTDRLLHLLPLFHVHGLVVAQLGALYANACTIWMPKKWTPQEVVDVWQSQNISICMMVPTIVHRLLSVNVVPALPHLRLVTSGSAPLPVVTHQTFQEKYGRHIVERYGMTEVGIVLSNPYTGNQRAGTVGFPLGKMQFRIVNTEGVECAVDEVGELLISGPSVISGYWEQPEATERTLVNGWLYSGDLATIDAEGYYSIVGRSKDLIISGGFNVYPQEVEKALLTCDGVEDVAVVGLPSQEWGEEVVAVVIGTVDWLTVREKVTAVLAPYKRPKHMLGVEKFPRNAMGKVQKSKLRELVRIKFG
jgi:malonyl-CoA/methylmalonyl-CoA synthetase